MAVNVNYFLEQKFNQYQTKEIVKTMELYDGIDNKYVAYLFAILHQEFNNLFRFMFGKANYHFNADKSRKLLEYIKLYEDMQYVLKNTDLAFEIVPSYQKLIDESKQFLKQSGGSTIPRELEKIKLLEYETIFNFIETVKVRTNGEDKKYSRKLIGEGSYAHVFKYRDEFYDKPFVIKRAKKELTSEELERFKREFAEMKKMNSPYIVEVYNYNMEKNEYTMEFLDYTLLNFIKQNNNKLSFKTRVNLVNQFFKALEYIHSQRILHRDISYTNILIKEYDSTIVLKMSDFGLVKTIDSDLTRISESVKGSLQDPNLYVVGYKNYRLEHEIYSAMFIVNYIMTGRKDFSDCDNSVLKEFLLKGINSDMDKRYKSAEEMRKCFIQIFEN